MRDTNTIVRQYVALWNEPDAQRRREAIAELWREDGAQILQPPEEIRVQAEAVGFFSPTLEARGHAALEARATVAFESFIAPGEFVFRQREDAVRLGDVVKFRWEMVAVDGVRIAGWVWSSSASIAPGASSWTTSSSRPEGLPAALAPICSSARFAALKSPLNAAQRAANDSNCARRGLGARRARGVPAGVLHLTWLLGTRQDGNGD